MNTTMQIAILNSPQHIEIQELNLPEPRLGEVRIKIKQAGICGSDVHFFQGHRKLSQATILGHEAIGYIDKIGEGVENRKLGQRVVIDPNIICGKCNYCKRGKGNICVNKRIIGQTEPGCFAAYVCVPNSAIFNLPDQISDDDAVCIEPMAVAYHALFSSQAKPGDSIAVIGLGSIGMLLTHLAINLGYQVFVHELNAVLLNKACDLGAQRFYDTDYEKVNAFLTQKDIQVIFECAGNEKTASFAAEIAPRGSEIILLGLSEKLANYQPLKITREGIQIKGSIIYDHPFDFLRVIELLKSHVINPSLIISQRMPLSSLQEALELASSGHAGKIIIEPK